MPRFLSVAFRARGLVVLMSMGLSGLPATLYAQGLARSSHDAAEAYPDLTAAVARYANARHGFERWEAAHHLVNIAFFASDPARQTVAEVLAEARRFTNRVSAAKRGFESSLGPRDWARVYGSHADVFGAWHRRLPPFSYPENCQPPTPDTMRSAIGAEAWSLVEGDVAFLGVVVAERAIAHLDWEFLDQRLRRFDRRDHLRDLYFPPPSPGDLLVPASLAQRRGWRAWRLLGATDEERDRRLGQLVRVGGACFVGLNPGWADAQSSIAVEQPAQPPHMPLQVLTIEQVGVEVSVPATWRRVGEGALTFRSPQGSEQLHIEVEARSVNVVLAAYIAEVAADSGRQLLRRASVPAAGLMRPLLLVADRRRRQHAWVSYTAARSQSVVTTVAFPASVDAAQRQQLRALALTPRMAAPPGGRLARRRDPLPKGG